MLAVAVVLATTPAQAIDVLVTQYKADPSGAAFAVGLEKGFFKKAGIDITGVISGAGGGTSVRNAIASDLGYGEVSPGPVITAIQQGQDIRIVNIGSRTLDYADRDANSLSDNPGSQSGNSHQQPRSRRDDSGDGAEKARLKSRTCRALLGSGALTAEKAVDATAIP
jgi:NitT/TauT family transport system substrate-binding protein